MTSAFLQASAYPPDISRKTLSRILLVLTVGAAVFWYGTARAGSTITVCASGCDSTTIQGAVNAASDGDTIQLLTSTPHTEFDIVVNKDVTIEGLGEITTIVQAAGSPGTAPNRVFFILSGKTVTIKDMTIRHGKTNMEGGGIFNNGGDLTLTDVRVEANQAPLGGGIYNGAGTLTIQDSLIKGNQNVVEGGGIFNLGTLHLEDSVVSSNDAREEGGGIYNSGTVTIRDSQISANDVLSLSAFDIQGGGLFNSGTAHIIDSSIVFNSVTGNSNALSAGGGGIYNEGTLEVFRSDISSNSAGSDTEGAGLFLRSGNARIVESTITLNVATAGFARAGGFSITSGNVTIEDSTIHKNSGNTGGGVRVGGGSVDITRTTISENDSNTGGGLHLCFTSGDVTLTNVTVSANLADSNGGGIYVCYLGEVRLANATLTANIADFDDNGSGNGGGIYLQTFNNDPGIAQLRNTIIQGNFDLTDIPGPRASDCHGALTSGGNNLIGTLGFWLAPGQPCSVAGTTTGNKVGVDAMLAPLADNGGPTQTHALMSGSPAINAGNPAGCLDYSNKPLPKDQRGGLRTNRCDIGAYEAGALVDHLYMPLLNKR